MKFDTLASVLFQKHVLCTVRSRLKSTGCYTSTSLLIRIQTCVQFPISSTLPKVHKAPVLNKLVSKHGRGIQSVPRTELPYFQTSQLVARGKTFLRLWEFSEQCKLLCSLKSKKVLKFYWHMNSNSDVKFSYSSPCLKYFKCGLKGCKTKQTIKLNNGTWIYSDCVLRCLQPSH
jgi:hypothetical protein